MYSLIAGILFGYYVMPWIIRKINEDQAKKEDDKNA